MSTDRANDTTGHYPVGYSDDDLDDLRCACGDGWPCTRGEPTSEAPAPPPCRSVLMIGGAAFPCDWPTDDHGKHPGWAHANKNCQAIWGKGQRPNDMLYNEGARERAEAWQGAAAYDRGFTDGLNKGVQTERDRRKHFDFTTAKAIVESHGYTLNREPGPESPFEPGTPVVVDPDGSTQTLTEWVCGGAADKASYELAYGRGYEDGVAQEKANQVGTLTVPGEGSEVLVDGTRYRVHLEPITSSPSSPYPCPSFGCGSPRGHDGDHDPGELWAQIDRQRTKNAQWVAEANEHDAQEAKQHDVTAVRRNAVLAEQVAQASAEELNAELARRGWKLAFDTSSQPAVSTPGSFLSRLTSEERDQLDEDVPLIEGHQAWDEPTVAEVATLIKTAIFDRSDGRATSGTEAGLSTKAALKVLDEYVLIRRTD